MLARYSKDCLEGGVDNMSDGVTIMMLLILLAFVIVFGPLAGIWAINTLFGLTIAYTFKTWLAALILGGVVGGTSKAQRK